MEPLHNRLPAYALSIIAEGLAYVGTERPLIPGKSPRESALKVLAAYIRTNNPKAQVKSHSLEQLETQVNLPERCKQVINHRRAFGNMLSDYETCLSMRLLNK